MAQILIVDDDDLIAALASNLLSAAGHACGWVSSGEDALDLLKWRSPDLLLLDQDMPGMSGTTVLRMLRASPEHRDLPVIMFTAVNGHEIEQNALVAGANDFISKPLNPALLAFKVDRLLETRARQLPYRASIEVGATATMAT
ncbi:response regulator [Altererythrobacter sp.]|uniref:response regulator n=1 Tax=Altererythrobacter sp. TaxID=1872480 RepID=UPI003D08DC7A